ncbi:MAG: gliding motility-associated C-terminal domain-containing protein [Phaeodactylibacter sp.]|uniref:T9SS type B sorting domain-containing protein n=1 Tax=Phaeodactylibacter sp. TaxID=1940289 RepID=UPI0032EFB08E
MNANLTRRPLRALLPLLFLLVPGTNAWSQDFTIIAENQNLYSVDIDACEVTFLSSISPPSVSFTDITYTPDGQLWGISADGRLYRVSPNTGATVLMTTIPQGSFSFYTSLVADQNGLIYTVGSNGNVYTYNPATDTAEFLGQSNYGSAGDLTFVDGQLVMAGISNQMIEIDLDNPGNSTPVLNFSVGGSIFGVVTFVEDCENTVTYASNDSWQGAIFSIDFVNGDLIPVCNAGVVIYGAASELEFLAAAPLELETLQIVPTSCAVPLGAVTVEISGGNGGLMYSLDGQGAQSSNVFDSLLPGTYTILVEDDFGCTLEVEAEVEAIGSAPVIESVEVEGTTCGDTNGSLAILAEGGETPYEFSIDGATFGNANLFSDLPSGTYLATVSDAQGCTDEVEIEIDSSSAPLINGIDIDPCEAAGVRLTISVLNGIAPYTYSINGVDFQSGPVFNNIPSGTLTVTVRDEAECESMLDIEVPEATPLPTLSTTTTPVSCTNDGGTVTVNTGSATGLAFSLDGSTFADNPVFAALPAGTYTVTVQNELGCTENFEVTVEDLEDGPQVAELEIENTTCGAGNGRLELSISSGTPPFTYQLGTGAPQPSPVFENLSPGTYQLNVEDGQGCTLEVAAAIGESLPLSINVAAAPCGAGASTLSIETTGGSSMGLEYRLNQGIWQPDPLFDSLDPGLYTVEARDSGGCMDSREVEIAAVPALTLDLDFVRGCGPGESALKVSGSGGNGGLRYQLNSGAVQTSGVFTGLSAGSYQLSVVDSAGCSSEDLQVDVPGAQPLQLSVQSTQPARCAEPNGTLTLAGNGGTPPYAYAVNGQVQNGSFFEGLPTGIASLLLTDAEGCTRADSLELVSECPVYAPSAFSPNGDGRNDRFELFSGLPFFVVRYQIFDRWGGLLYEAAGFDSDTRSLYWDGTAAGDPVNTGYYTYYIEVLDGQEKPLAFKGGVMLVQ